MKSTDILHLFLHFGRGSAHQWSFPNHGGENLAGRGGGITIHALFKESGIDNQGGGISQPIEAEYPHPILPHPTSQGQYLQGKNFGFSPKYQKPPWFSVMGAGIVLLGGLAISRQIEGVW
jgi:hypothetical protein